MYCTGARTAVVAVAVAITVSLTGTLLYHTVIQNIIVVLLYSGVAVDIVVGHYLRRSLWILTA